MFLTERQVVPGHAGPADSTQAHIIETGNGVVSFPENAHKKRAATDEAREVALRGDKTRDAWIKQLAIVFS